MDHPAPATNPAINHDALIRRIAWRLMPLIMVCYFFAFFDRINISFAKAQLQTDLSLSNAAYGLGASLFVVGYVLFEVPSNLMLYRTGARRWIARIMVSWGLATAAMALVSSEWQFYAVRFVIGAMEAGFAPGILFYLTLWFPPSFRGRVTSMLFVASAFSGIIGAPLAGLILRYMDGVLGLPGWNWLFLLGGLPCVALGGVVFLVLKDRVEDAHWMSSAEQAYLRTQLAGADQTKEAHSLFGALRTPGFLVIGLVYFLIQIGSYGLNFWAPDLIRTAGGSNPAVVGLLTAVPYVCGAITMIVLGRMSDASGERARYVAGLIAVAGVGFFAAGFFSADVTLLVIALAVIGSGVVASVPAFWALPPKLLTGAGAAGGIALINTLGQVGGIVSPILVGKIKDMTGSATSALYLIGALCLVCAVILLVAMPASIRRNERTGAG